MKLDFIGTVRSIFVLVFTMVCAVVNYGQPTVVVPDGYATQNGGTTGGGSATPVTVTTASAFKAAAVGNNNPAVIVVQGRLNVGSVSIGSNKTIIGADTRSGLYGGNGLSVDGSNYIFQNLTIGPASGDTMEMSGATNVFIHKCEFYGSTDELCSIVRESDYITISWSKFYFSNSSSHSFAHLIGNSDSRTSDRGKLHVTLHHNWYAEGLRGRLPRVRFGHVHIYNNYYNATDTGYCIGIGVECHIRVENTHFKDSDNPWANYGGTSNGEIGWANLKFEGTSQPTFMPNKFPVFTPPYSFTLDAVDDVKSFVTDPVYGAGNCLPLDTVYAKTLSHSEDDLLPWFYAQAVTASDGEGTIIQAASVDANTAFSDANELQMVARLDSDGNCNGRVMAEDFGTELSWTSDANLVIAHRFTPNHNGLTLRMVEASEGLSTVFEKTLVLSSNKADLAVLSNKCFSIIQDCNEDIRVVVFANTGDILWSKIYSAPEFAAQAQKQVCFHELPDGYLLSVMKGADIVEGNITLTQRTAILVGLDPNGTVLWSNVYTGIGSPYKGEVIAQCDGNVFLLDTPNDLFTGGIITKLDSQGQLAWSRHFPDINLQVKDIGSIAGNKTFISATELDEHEKRRGYYALVDESGSVEKQIRVHASEIVSGMAIASDDRIWYALSLNDQNEPGPVYEKNSIVIGASSLSLDDWQWQQYDKPVSSGMLWPCFDGSLVFSAFHSNTGSLDLIEMTQGLVPDLPCQPFYSVDVLVEPISKTISPVSIDIHPVTVTQYPWIPQFTRGTISISLRTFDCQEAAICVPKPVRPPRPTR